MNQTALKVNDRFDHPSGETIRSQRVAEKMEINEQSFSHLQFYLFE